MIHQALIGTLTTTCAIISANERSFDREFVFSLFSISKLHSIAFEMENEWVTITINVELVLNCMQVTCVGMFEWQKEKWKLTTELPLLYRTEFYNNANMYNWSKHSEIEIRAIFSIWSKCNCISVYMRFYLRSGDFSIFEEIIWQKKKFVILEWGVSHP